MFAKGSLNVCAALLCLLLPYAITSVIAAPATTKAVSTPTKDVVLRDVISKIKKLQGKATPESRAAIIKELEAWAEAHGTKVGPKDQTKVEKFGKGLPSINKNCSWVCYKVAENRWIICLPCGYEEYPDGNTMCLYCTCVATSDPAAAEFVNMYL